MRRALLLVAVVALVAGCAGLARSEGEPLDVLTFNIRYANPGDGEDTLVSTIEIKEDGSILANGQRIK